MSYATGLAKTDAAHGLFGASIPSFVYAIMGTCAQLSVAPEAALSLLAGQAASDALRKLPVGTSQHEQNSVATAVITLVTFQAGLITMLLGLLRLGFLDSVLSKPLLRGFISAVGVVIFIEQLVPLLGLPPVITSSNHTYDKLVAIIAELNQTHKLTFIISFVTLIILIAYRTVKPGLFQRYPAVRFIPEVLITVVFTTILSYTLDWQSKGVLNVGHISAAHVKFRLPITHHNFQLMRETLPTSAVVAVAGFIDSIVAGKENAARFNQHLSPNRELVALGSANLVASLFHGTLPGYGSITRSRLNAAAGARTPFASLLTATFTLVTTYFLLSYLSYLPKAILSTIIVLVVYSILQEVPHDLSFYFRIKAYGDLGLMLATFLLTVVLSVETGLVVSIAFSLLAVVQRSSNMQVSVMGRNKATEEWITLTGDSEETEEIPGTLACRIRGNMTFTNANALKERLRRLEQYGQTPSHPSKSPLKDAARLLVLHMGDVDEIDGSACQTLLEVVQTYRSRDVDVYLTHVSEPIYYLLQKAGMGKLIDDDHFQADIRSAMQNHNRLPK